MKRRKSDNLKLTRGPIRAKKPIKSAGFPFVIQRQGNWKSVFDQAAKVAEDRVERVAARQPPFRRFAEAVKNYDI